MPSIHLIFVPHLKKMSPVVMKCAEIPNEDTIRVELCSASSSLHEMGEFFSGESNIKDSEGRCVCGSSAEVNTV